MSYTSGSQRWSSLVGPVGASTGSSLPGLLRLIACADPDFVHGILRFLRRGVHARTRDGPCATCNSQNTLCNMQQPKYIVQHAPQPPTGVLLHTLVTGRIRVLVYSHCGGGPLHERTANALVFRVSLISHTRLTGVASPPDLAAQYSEPLLFMPHSYFVNDMRNAVRSVSHVSRCSTLWHS